MQHTHAVLSTNNAQVHANICSNPLHAIKNRPSLPWVLLGLSMTELLTRTCKDSLAMALS